MAASADGEKDYDDSYEHEKHDKVCRRSKKPWSYECAMYHGRNLNHALLYVPSMLIHTRRAINV